MLNTAKDTHKITNYECVRLARIKDNQEKLESLGLKQLATFVPRNSAQLKCTNAKMKRVSAEIDDDDDYVPSIRDNDNDDESSNSSMHEVLYMRFSVCNIVLGMIS